MKTAYTPDNTRPMVIAMFVIAAIVTAVAVLLGGNDKPDVSTIMIVPPDAAGASAPAADTFGFGAADTDPGAESAGTVLLDEFGEPFGDSAQSGSGAADEDGSASGDELATAADSSGDSTLSGDDAGTGDDARVPQGEIIVVPTSEPTPTPEVAAAVEPTPSAATDAEDEGDADGAAPSSSLAMPTAAGSVQGSFFTKSDENEGAVVAQNLITLDFAEDGTGSFQGVLEITYGDDTHVLLNMSGPLVLAPTNPQVETTLTGAFTLDSTIDTDDVTASDADLSISSLAAGTGSLCTTKCFGFTFPPQ